MANPIYEGDDYHRARHPDLLEDSDLRVGWSVFADLAYFRSVKRSDVVLEVGGGLGANLIEVAKRAASKMVEPSPLGRKVASDAGITVYADLAEVALDSVDTVLCRHVLEHVDQPLTMLTDIMKVMKKEGRLILVLPCEDMDLLPSNEDIDHHMYCWSPRTIGNLLQRTGFKVTDIRYEYYGGRRKFLFIGKRFGWIAYARAVRFIGKVFRSRELIIEAELA